MGLGKTLTTIALIASTLDATASPMVNESSARISSPVEEYNRITLIITPKSSKSPILTQPKDGKLIRWQLCTPGKNNSSSQ